MGDILYKSGILVLVIALGYLTKKLGLFSKERDFTTISNIILYITLPAAVLINLNGLRFPASLLGISIFGFLCNWMYIFIARKFSKSKTEQSFATLNINGYNIGNFSLPFISFFLEGIPILAISLFDAGSSIMVLGGNYAIAESIEKENVRFDYADLIKKIFQSPPVLAYTGMVVLSLLNLNLPTAVVDIVTIIGNANTFLAMFVIGLALELYLEKVNIKKLVKYITLRYIPAILLSLLISIIPNIPNEIKITLTLILLAPIAGSAPIFTGRIDNDVELSAQINSLSIIVSVVLMSSYLVYLGV